jgi:hypothetical protein
MTMESTDTALRGAPSSRFATNEPAVIADVIDGETIIMNLDAGHYYSLNASAGEIWQLLTAGRTRAEAATTLAARYGRQFTETQLDAFIEELLRHALLVRNQEPRMSEPASTHEQAGTHEGARPAGGNPPQSWSAPEITVYHDMKDLLAMDPPIPSAARSPA